VVVDRKHTSCHGLSFRNVIHSGIVHTSGILVSLLLGKRAKLRKVPGLVAIIAWSPHLSSSSRWTALSYLGLRYCHFEWFLIPLLWLGVLILPLRWSEPCTRCWWMIRRMTCHRSTCLWRTWLESPLVTLGCGVGIVVVL
jgi:hypothetical protein